ncbi:hypothetical protein KR067_001035 [Drosophila pandora]|nr:hypothetical protein KR067_001035 [Drosophila pandora]
MDYDDEDSRFHYKMQASHYRHSSESLHRGDRDRDDEERSCTPQEQFEPILSDDEIIGDDEEDDAEDAAAIAEYKRELEAAAAAATDTDGTDAEWIRSAIIKKMHLWEALGSVHDCCRRLFLERNPEKSKDAEFKTETVILCKKIEYSFQMLMEALSTSQLSYQQPWRFLPESKKFEVVTDSMAQRSFANALQSFLRYHALAESLLLTRPHFSPTPPAPICPPQIQIKC